MSDEDKTEIRNSQIEVVGDNVHVKGGIHFHIVTALEEKRDVILEKLPGYQKEKPTEDDIRVYYSAQLPVKYLSWSKTPSVPKPAPMD